ncbi:TfoX/Sxy family protein [Rhodobacter sp. Har01]|uniref:TfoX/Sxy family protein n=1 Tax=Rhodobacter sp. Har01 TaxID=2883999 RepID=UPI001D090EE3|nr:TfoX/Sxy family protein [Rhodobacter sp. Har01]MCB6176545.1 TfoX/Sxy family protein [Rhodobacter sp. Har01]
MAFDPALADLLRRDLAGKAVTEQPMFGGLAFLSAGHMLAGVHRGGLLYRVARADRAAALALPGVFAPMMGVRPMAGMVALPPGAADDARRAALLALALHAVQALPPKVAKPRKGC